MCKNTFKSFQLFKYPYCSNLNNNRVYAVWIWRENSQALLCFDSSTIQDKSYKRQKKKLKVKLALSKEDRNVCLRLSIVQNYNLTLLLSTTLAELDALALEVFSFFFSISQVPPITVLYQYQSVVLHKLSFVIDCKNLCKISIHLLKRFSKYKFHLKVIPETIFYFTSEDWKFGLINFATIFRCLDHKGDSS